MFSEELRILDRNTVQYMIDEMEDEIRKKADQLKEKEEQLKEQKNQLKEQENQLKNKDVILDHVCRSFIAECQEREGTMDEAIQIIRQRTGMDQDTAAEMVKRLWKQ